MKSDYIKELISLTPRQHNIVLGGLINKLSFHERTGILSYRYDVCPVCKDVGSTEQEPKCERCYIHSSCKAPFNDGFRDDIDAGVAYFAEMKEVLESVRFPSALVVGGNWDANGGKSSKIAALLAGELRAHIYNGGYIDELPNNVSSYDLVVWMPNVPNEEVKHYPKKKTGAVLVCSKVMHERYVRADAVTRIFKMNGNAVIQIRVNDETGMFNFELTDALGNSWVSTSNVVELTKAILRLNEWTNEAIRARSIRMDSPSTDLERLMICVRTVADGVENSIGERYFGNVSTRCQKMFPGMREKEFILISPRNTDKRRLEAEDMVPVRWSVNDEVQYWGARKPSVDAPVQLSLFSTLPSVNFFIHGHAKVVGAVTTTNYYPCGDLREVEEVKVLIQNNPNSYGIINLKNHGFLLYSNTIEDMEKLVATLKFDTPN